MRLTDSVGRYEKTLSRQYQVQRRHTRGNLPRFLYVQRGGRRRGTGTFFGERAVEIQSAVGYRSIHAVSMVYDDFVFDFGDFVEA